MSWAILGEQERGSSLRPKDSFHLARLRNQPCNKISELVPVLAKVMKRES